MNINDSPPPRGYEKKKTNVNDFAIHLKNFLKLINITNRPNDNYLLKTIYIYWFLLKYYTELKSLFSTVGRKYLKVKNFEYFQKIWKKSKKKFVKSKKYEKFQKEEEEEDFC